MLQSKLEGVGAKDDFDAYLKGLRDKRERARIIEESEEQDQEWSMTPLPIELRPPSG